MLVLGVETSCDETAVSLVRDGQVVANAVRTQVERHAPFGGVVPDIAARMHIEAVGYVAREAFAQAGATPGEVDAVAATTEPGLVNCLVVGAAWGRSFAVARDLPFVAVDHLEAHVFACGMAPPGQPYDPALLVPPSVALLVSGGHTALYRYDGPGALRRLARTVDDASGEAFDKVAVLLGLGYPGGPEIERAAAGGDPRAYGFPRSHPKRSPTDFSFSGLKTAVLYATRGQNKRREDPLLPGTRIADVAASFQEAVCDVLVDTALKVTRREGLARLALCGGVACNSRLREMATARGQAAGVEVTLAPKVYCTDNAAMVAGLAWARLQAGLAPVEDDLARPSSARSSLGS